MGMTAAILAIQPPHGAASSVGSGTHWLAIGLLAGILVARIAPPWLMWVIIIFDLVALGWSFGILRYTDSARGRWVLIGAIFLVIGLFLGVKNGLKHLSEAEYTTRLSNIRKLGRYL
jgi:hypothetical protein